MSLPYEYSAAEITLFGELGALVEAQSRSIVPTAMYKTVLPASILRAGIVDWRRDAARCAMVAVEVHSPLRMTDEFDRMITKPSRRLFVVEASAVMTSARGWMVMPSTPWSRSAIGTRIRVKVTPMTVVRRAIGKLMELVFRMLELSKDRKS